MHIHAITIAMHPALVLFSPIPAICVIAALHYLLIQCLRSEFWGALSRWLLFQNQPQLDWHQLWQVCICAFSQIWPFCGLSWRVLAFCLKCPVCLYHKQLPLHVLPKFPFLYFNTDTYYCVLSGHEVLCPFHLLVKACSLYFIFACAKLF